MLQPRCRRVPTQSARKEGGAAAAAAAAAGGGCPEDGTNAGGESTFSLMMECSLRNGGLQFPLCPSSSFFFLSQE